MNIDDGKLHMLTKEEAEKIARSPFKENLIPINIDDATDKQKENMCVSLHDHKSKLGKQLTKARRQNCSKRKKRRNKK